MRHLKPRVDAEGVKLQGSAYQFGNFTLDSGRFELLREGRSLRLERKPMELLILLAESGGRLVSRAEIAERLWKSEVFVDTEHGINTAIRKIRTVLADEPDEPKFIQTVTGMGYRFIAEVQVVGSHAEAVVATEELPRPREAPGQAVESSVANPTRSAEPVPVRSRRKFIWIGAGAILLMAATLTVTVGPHPLAARLLYRDTGAPINSLAVIPLENLSGDANQEYFADGMTDELITMLAKDSTLRVTSRTSVMQYKGAHRPLPEIARALNVDAILEGSVSKSGNQVHMNLQLIRGETDSHVWADSFDRDNNDVSTLPDAAARAIAKRLGRVEASAAPARTINPEAHDDYLRGQYDWTVAQNKEAGEYFQKAVRIQPDYAEGWAGVSEYLDLEALNGTMKPLEVLPEALSAARRAVSLDDTLPLAHNSLAAGVLFLNWDTKTALQELDRAIQLDPQNSQSLHLKAKILCALGRYDEANDVQAMSTAANAFAHPGARAEIFACTRRFDDAIREGQLRLRDMPTSADILEMLAISYHCTGHEKEAVDYLARQYAAEGKATIAETIRRAYATGGYRAVVRAELADAEHNARASGVSPVALARLQAMLGEREAAIKLLIQAADEHAPYLVFRVNDPAFDSLHSDPRFQAISKETGLPME